MLTGAALANVLTAVFQPQIVSQFNRSNPSVKLIPVKRGAGKNCQFVIRTGTAKGEAIADGDDVGSYNSDTKTPAVLQWARYSDAFAITGDAFDIAASSPNPEELVMDLFGEELLESQMRVAAAIGEHVFTGDASASPTELAGLVEGTNGALKATGTYATINKGSVTQFQGNEDLNGGIARPLTTALMQRQLTNIRNSYGMDPDLIICSPTQFERYGLLLGDKRRYMQEVTLRGKKIVLDGGFSALDFAGKPVVWDHNCPDEDMLFLNTNFVEWRTLPPAGRNALTAPAGSAGVRGTDEEQLGPGETQLGAYINHLAQTGDAHKFQLITKLQLIVRRPNACSILGDLEA